MRSTRIFVSVAASATMIFALIMINQLASKYVLWWPWTLIAFIWWPAAAIAGKNAKTVMFATFSAIVIILYFYLLYSVRSPGVHPWYLYIIPLAVWWPVSVGVGKHRNNFIFLIISLLVFTTYYGYINYKFSPNYPWIIYPVFVFLWIAILLYFINRKKPVTLSIVGAVLTIVFFIVVNYINSPNVIWAVYPVFVTLWWPLSMIFFSKHTRIKT